MSEGNQQSMGRKANSRRGLPAALTRWWARPLRNRGQPARPPQPRSPVLCVANSLLKCHLLQGALPDGHFQVDSVSRRLSFSTVTCFITSCT